MPHAGLDGSIADTNIHGSIAGAGDSSYQIAMLLMGGQALSISQFENYKPASSLGLSLTITAPTAAELCNLHSAKELTVCPETKWN